MLKKYLSQNFLIDKNIIKKIINEISIDHNDVLLEIGPGHGALSKYILNLARKLILVEIDKNFILSLEKNIQCEKIKIYSDNILSFDFQNIIKITSCFRIVGNIPYKISTKLILHLSTIKKNIKDIHFVIQNELSDKLIKNKRNSYTKVLINYHFNIEKKFTIQAASFNPKPKVDSVFIKMTPRIYGKKSINYDCFKDLIKLIFIKKQKHLLNCINNVYCYDKYINIEKPINNLSLNDYIRLSNLIFLNKKD